MIRSFGLLIFALFVSLSAMAVQSSVDNPQGVLWRLRESGRLAEANQYEEHLIKVLTTASLTQVAQFKTKTSPSYLVHFGGNLVAFMKESEKGIPRGVYYEHAAYVVDKVLGLNMVPLTVLREINGKVYSLQLFYPARPWVRDLPEDHEINTVRAKDMRVFDKMIANVDRDVQTGHNAVVGIDGRLVGIDHTRSFQDVSMSMWGLEVLSTEMKQKVLSTPMSAFRAALSPTLTDAEITIFEQKTKLMIEHILKMKDRPLPAANIERDFVIPEVFKEPLPLSEVRFMDFVAVQTALGAGAKAEFAKTIAGIVQSTPDKYYLYRLVIENWKTYPAEVRRAAMAVVAAHEGSHDQNFLESIVREEPHLIFEILKSERIVRRYSYVIYYGLMNADVHKITPDLYSAALSHLLDQVKKSSVGINFEEMFRGPNVSLRDRFLREFYEALVRDGMALNMAAIFRLGYEKNQNLPALLLQVTSPEQKDIVRKQLISSTESLLRASDLPLDRGPGLLLAGHIEVLRQSAGGGKMCQDLFGL